MGQYRLRSHRPTCPICGQGEAGKERIPGGVRRVYRCGAVGVRNGDLDRHSERLERRCGGWR